jgi:DNA-binding IclR family transcriptional regulator
MTTSSRDDDRKTQVIARAARVLEIISRMPRRGARLVDLANESGIARPSVYRILRDLEDVGYVRQLPDKRYVLGPQIFMLGLGVSSPIADPAKVQRAAQRLADVCGDTVYVGIRHFDGVHYVVRTEGDSPVRSFRLSVGETVPFVISQIGLVMLASMDEDERERHIDSEPIGYWVRRIGGRYDADRVREAVRRTQEDGYWYGAGFVDPDGAGLAMAVPSRTAVPFVGINIHAPAVRLTAERAAELLPHLRTAVKSISEALATESGHVTP